MTPRARGASRWSLTVIAAFGRTTWPIGVGGSGYVPRTGNGGGAAMGPAARPEHEVGTLDRRGAGGAPGEFRHPDPLIKSQLLCL